MKYCVTTYSFGKYAGELDIYEIIDRVAKQGFDGIEFADAGWRLDGISPGELGKIGSYAREKGLETVDLCVGAELLNDPDGVKKTCENVDRAAALGVKMLRHDISSGKKGVSYASCVPFLADRCREITSYAESVGIRTMTENHGYFSQDADRVEALICAVNHRNFGALVDLGNFMCADEEPTVSTAKMMPYAFHVHAKDFLYKKGTEPYPGRGWFRTRAGNYLRGTVIGHGTAGIAQSVGTVVRSGYDGYLSVEFEGLEDVFDSIADGLENLKRFVALNS